MAAPDREKPASGSVQGVTLRTHAERQLAPAEVKCSRRARRLPSGRRRPARAQGACPLAFDATGQSVLLTLGGIKSPYSDGFFTPTESAAADQMDRCEALKARCDPGCRLLRLHEKCVLRQ